MIHFELPSRDAGVVNISDPANQGMCVKAFLNILPVPGPNTSVRFDTALVATHRVWNTLVHNTGAFDADGDILSFDLVTPAVQVTQSVTGYQFPTAANMFWLDPATGTLLWDYPPQAGLWSVAIRCTEWRNGYLIGQVTRDMSICIGSFELGLATATMNAPLTLSPNLVDDLLTITGTHTGWHELEIIDVAGAICLRTNFSSDRTTIEVSTLSSGLYTVRLREPAGRTRFGRFVKH